MFYGASPWTITVPEVWDKAAKFDNRIGTWLWVLEGLL